MSMGLYEIYPVNKRTYFVLLCVFLNHAIIVPFYCTLTAIMQEARYVEVEKLNTDMLKMPKENFILISIYVQYRHDVNTYDITY